MGSLIVGGLRYDNTSESDDDKKNSVAGNQCLVVGCGNSITTANQNWNMVVGKDNQITSDYNNSSIMFGVGNQIIGSTVKGNRYQCIFNGGTSNIASGKHAFVYGANNDVRGEFTITLGASNTLKNANRSFIFGRNNTLTRKNSYSKSEYNYWFGNNNLSESGSGNYIFGSNNTANCSNSILIGNCGYVEQDNCIIFGTDLSFLCLGDKQELTFIEPTGEYYGGTEVVSNPNIYIDEIQYHLSYMYETGDMDLPYNQCDQRGTLYPGNYYTYDYIPIADSVSLSLTIKLHSSEYFIHESDIVMELENSTLNLSEKQVNEFHLYSTKYQGEWEIPTLYFQDEHTIIVGYRDQWAFAKFSLLNVQKKFAIKALEAISKLTSI